MPQRSALNDELDRSADFPKHGVIKNFSKNENIKLLCYRKMLEPYVMGTMLIDRT